MKKIFIIIFTLVLCLSACAEATADEAPRSEPEPQQLTELETVPEAEVKEEPEPVEEEPALPGPEEAAEKLSALGIMRGVPSAGGGTDFMLSEPVTRETAIALIARAKGHDSALDESYPLSPFTDVDGWAVGAVNYAKANGITNGISPTLLGSGNLITANEFAALILRAIGRGGEFQFEDAYEYALSTGVMAELEGDTVTRGDAARSILALITGVGEDGKRPLIASLLETGLVTGESVEAAGLTELAGEPSEGVLTAAEVYEANMDKLLTVDCYDRTGALIRSVHGAFISDYTAVAAYDDIFGAAKITITHGDETKDVIGINFYDEPSGIVSLSYYAGEPHPHFDAPSEPTAGTVYVLSSVASGEDYDGGFTAGLNAARPVVDAKGRFVGLTQRGSRQIKTVFNWYWGGTVPYRDFAAANWPEALYPRGLDPAKKMIALTFDDGPSRSVTPKLLDLFEKYGAVATFFEVGNMLKGNPQYLERMEELGCEVANHSYSHPNLNTLSKDKIKTQIGDTDAIIEEKLGHKAALVRAPYGNSNATVREVIGVPIIHWTLDTRDWESRRADAVYEKIVNGAYDGCIVLMHSLYEPTYQACVKAVPYLIENGYQLVTVSEMAELRGYEMQPGTVYYSFPQKK